MDSFAGVLAYFCDIRFVLMVLCGSVAGLFVGAIPGLSVSMATALLVSVTYGWNTADALGLIMGVYVVGVFSGAVSAILLNIPGAPSSVVTTLDGYPMACRGEAGKALHYATFYSFVGSLFGLILLWGVARPVTALALKFTPMDYCLLALVGLLSVGQLSGKSFSKGMLAALMGLLLSLVGIDSVVGAPRLTFGIRSLQAGISTVPALIGLFGFSEVLWVLSSDTGQGETTGFSRTTLRLKEMLGHFGRSLWYCTIGALVGALPGAGGPVASFLAYGQAKRLVKNPDPPFGEGAAEGIVASESANNACIGGALIPMLTLAVPGDAVTAIILSVFQVHGLRPGPMFLAQSPDLFCAVVAGGLIGSFCLLALGFGLAPRLSRVLKVPKTLLLPVIAALCVIGAYAGNSRLFDVWVMLGFGVAGYWMRRWDYPVAPLTLALVLGRMMDENFRRAVSLASSEEHLLPAMFGRPITLILTVAALAALAAGIRSAPRRPEAQSQQPPPC